MERDYRGLPEEYWSQQNFCWYMHDIILSIFNECTKNNKLESSIKLKNEDDAKSFEKRGNHDVLEWLKQNGYNDEADIVLGKRVFHAILADMLNFVYESLNTIEKGKIAVSLALLRKPFRDNLLYLEWLLAEPKEIINMVYNQDIDKYAVENIEWDKKKNIIDKAISKIDNQEFFSQMDGEMYFDLRYNYRAGNSLQLAWNNANHLVTTGKNIRSNEFNFVFLDKEEHLEYIEYYYKQIPHLLFYTYNIVIKLYEKYINPISNVDKIYNNFLIVYKFCDKTNQLDPKKYFNKDTEEVLGFPCEKCKKIISVDVNSKQFNEFRYSWSIKCPNCGEEITICRYVFWENYKEKEKRLKVVK